MEKRLEEILEKERDKISEMERRSKIPERPFPQQSPDCCDHYFIPQFVGGCLVACCIRCGKINNKASEKTQYYSDSTGDRK